MLVMQVWTLVVDSFREAIEKKLFWVMAGISALIALMMAMIELTDTRIIILFGVIDWETDVLSPSTPSGRAMIGELMATQIGRVYIGFAGTIIALVATSGTIPSLMRSGAIDVVLSKPISRTTLFLGKYLGAMVFVLIQATWFVLLTFLIAGLRWHYWQPRYLWCIPLLVLLFSYLYAFSALFGVMTRNAMAALLLTGLAWIAVIVPQYAHKTLLQAPMMGLNVDERWVAGANIARQIVPKTSDIMTIAGNLIGADELFSEQSIEDEQAASNPDASFFSMDPALAVEGERQWRIVNPVFSIGTSLAFEAVILGFAIRKFSRRDF